MQAFGWFDALFDEAKGTLEYTIAGLEIQVGEQILAIMESRGISLDALAKKLEIPDGELFAALDDCRNLSVELLCRITSVLGCDLKIAFGPQN